MKNTIHRIRILRALGVGFAAFLSFVSVIGASLMGFGSTAAEAATPPPHPLPVLRLCPHVCPAPKIVSVSPTTAGPGTTVIVSGSNFGTTRASGYLQFSDGGINWGAPGDAAPFTVTSWTGTSIEFQVPTLYGSWGPVGGSVATVQVTAGSGKSSNQKDITLSSTTPVINSVSPTTAAPGDAVVVNGQNFGTIEASGYIKFSDEGVNWGAPGDAAPFTVTSWSNTQIALQVPELDGSWGTVGGTEATVQVTNSANLSSNQMDIMMSTAVHWPLSVDSGNTNIDNSDNDCQNMDTGVTINSQGQLTANTTVDDSCGGFCGQCTGYHGATMITLYDRFGDILEQWGNGPFGITNNGSCYIPSLGGTCYTTTWTEQLSASDLLSLYSVSVVNYYDPQNSIWTAIQAWFGNNWQVVIQDLGGVVAALA